jgi:hypothetical protein
MTRYGIAAALAAVAAFALPASAQAASYADTVLADDPLTYLRMGETSGTVAEDATANDRDGTYNGSPALGAAGPFLDAGTAVGITSTSSVTGSVDEPSGSIELWVDPARVARGQQAGIASHGDPAGDGWALGIGAKRKLAFVSGGSTYASKISLGSGVWTLLTVTWDGQKVRIYRNGSMTKSINRNAAAPASTSHALVLGGNGAGAFSGRYSGKFDELALYSQVLDAATISAHFQAAHVPINTAPPTIGGTTTVGETLTVAPGSWSDAGSATITYQWQRCDTFGEDCVDIAGATGTSYLIAAGDDCYTLQVAETVTNTSGGDTAFSSVSDAVGPCVVPEPAPVNSAPPTIGGTQTVGETLTANPGTWSDAATATWTYQWRRCDPLGANCADIDGATGDSHVLAAADDCMTLQVAETVTNSTAADTAVSDVTSAVGPCITPDPTPDPTPTPTPTPEPTPTPTPGPTGGGTPAGSGGSVPRTIGTTAGAGCLRVVAGRKRVKLRRYGVLRLKLVKNACLTAPVRAKVKPRKGMKLRSVRYTLDGKRLKRVRKVRFAARLRTARLTAGKHTLKLRVRPLTGKPKTFKVRLRLAVA